MQSRRQAGAAGGRCGSMTIALAQKQHLPCGRWSRVLAFLSALLVLLRLAPLRRNGLQEAAALQELHYSVLQELLLQEAQEADAAAAALSGMPGQPNSSQLAAAAGLPAGARPTAEQLKVVHAVAAAPGANNDLVLINALPLSTAKSTTLKLLMHANPESVFLYTAFNKVVVEDARSSTPRHVDCKTTHQLAAPKREEMKARPRGWQLWNGGLMVDEIWDALKQLPYYQQRVAAGSKGPPRQVAAAVKEALDKFVTSADRRLGRQHLPKALDPLSDPPDYVEVAQQMWQAIMDSSCRPLKFSHNTYLKQFSDSLVDNQGILRNWRGQRYQIILIDEAQDVNLVTLQMLLSQPCLRVLVGDRHQHIYSFNHCANALEGAAAAAAAARRPSRVRSYSLSSSFRLGPAVAAVANKLLWQLGERKRPLVGVGWQHAAVYRQVKPDHAQQGTAAAAAAGQAEGAEGAEAGAEEAYFEQVQLLPQQTTTDHTPAQLESLSLRVDTKDGPKQLHLALPPVDPQTGKRKPLCGRVEFLENVLGIYRLKYQGMRFRQYSSWDDLEKAAERREDADLLGAIGLVRKYKQATQQLVDAIKDAQVLRKADADFILGTCHKAKGCEEDYVQLADDFTPIQAGRQPDVEVDEYNLLYVAATRAKLALVLNPDLQQLLLAGSHRPVLMQLRPAGCWRCSKGRGCRGEPSSCSALQLLRAAHG
ncbi:hypothetical protein OEZ86_006695 [Tetradesmus obliquus]|nr:hypothetical protein OEZ86_006695 [Tetradesmus obliquus]